MEVKSRPRVIAADADLLWPGSGSWPLAYRILFRFLFVYFFLFMSPWTWLDGLPYISTVTSFFTNYINQAIEWLVFRAHQYLFHFTDHLVNTPNGSGDRYYNYAEVCLYLLLAFAATIVWSIRDRKRKSYHDLHYLLVLFVRYYVALTAFGYGILKLFALQMPFPNYSMLVTSLGDLLPMRLSWLFIGYSAPYQIFSGAMEVLVGLLLFYRRTATLGALLAVAVFSNVFMLNLAYDIPVKLYSFHLTLLSIFLLSTEARRLSSFFLQNRPAGVCSVYTFSATKKWLRITRVVLKSILVMSIGWQCFQNYEQYEKQQASSEPAPLTKGVYDVAVFARNGDTLAPLLTDTTRWQDVVFNNGRGGSIKTSDTSFRRLYNRALFFFASDTVKKTMTFKKGPQSDTLLHFRYELPGDGGIRLWGKQKNDSLYIVLRKSHRHFQLAEKQFHWISEANR